MFLFGWSNERKYLVILKCNLYIQFAINRFQNKLPGTPYSAPLIYLPIFFPLSHFVSIAVD